MSKNKTTYWLVTTKSLREAISAHLDAQSEAIKQVLRFSRRHGGSRTRFGYDSSAWSVRISILFNNVDRVDQKKWRRCVRGEDEFWVPKRTAKKLCKEFAELEKAFPTAGDLRKLLGSKEDMRLAGRSITFGPAIAVAKVESGDVYVRVAGEFKPPSGLRRISDLEYERLTNPGKPRKKK